MHTLDPLTPTEIILAATLIRNDNPENRVHFKNLTLMEPLKKGLREFLAAERSGSSLPNLPRQVSRLYYHGGTVDGHLVQWQKWRCRVGFNWREGMVLHDVTYDERELFHRFSLSEMFVLYGDPRSPYSRKSVFDVGDIGAGVAANNLALGYDCLGLIKVGDLHLSPQYMGSFAR